MMRRLVDWMIGPGARPLDVALSLGWAVLVAGILVAHPIRDALGWTGVQLAVLAVVAFDLAGGTVALTTDAAKRRWGNPSTAGWAPVAFLVAHIHPLVMAATFSDIDWQFAALTYVFAVAAAITIGQSARSIQRPLSFMLFSFGYLALFYIFPLPEGWQWFIPLYLLKLVMAFPLAQRSAATE